MLNATSIKAKTYVVGKELAQGGQGTAYLATRADRPGEQYVVKQFHTVNPQVVERTKHIATQNFSMYAQTLAAPTDAISTRSELAVVSKYVANAIPLAELLEKGPVPKYGELMQIALQVTHAASYLHPTIDAHGDLHAGNVMVRQEPGLWRAWLIDFDNYAATAMPPPPALGFPGYMAPELLLPKAKPCHASDVFALAGLVHELVYLCSPFDGLGPTDADFERARGGPWIYDPAKPLASFNGAIPIAAQHPRLVDLFRRALQPDPLLRPKCQDFFEVFNHIVVNERLGQCSACGHPFVLHGTLAGCPKCGASFARTLVAANSQTFNVSGAMRFGRNQCGSPYVSEEHVGLDVKGAELFVTALSRNSPTLIETSQGWSVLPPGQTACLMPGVHMRLGDCEFLAK